MTTETPRWFTSSYGSNGGQCITCLSGCLSKSLWVWPFVYARSRPTLPSRTASFPSVTPRTHWPGSELLGRLIRFLHGRRPRWQVRHCLINPPTSAGLSSRPSEAMKAPPCASGRSTTGLSADLLPRSVRARRSGRARAQRKLHRLCRRASCSVCWHRCTKDGSAASCCLRLKAGPSLGTRFGLPAGQGR